MKSLSNMDNILEGKVVDLSNNTDSNINLLFLESFCFNL